ncbi:hypothetical protein GpartN1_g1200.t1 [Galdieria partita]|uniref:Probable ATP-dependent transporter ycf16 n=1 Tax=Galdieria partita TaxID=83374 RepID=A0A9C7PSF9_9RHOD|nr:hypothetical protein GpartN1_g1200.t1 [Galdieria partita]
MSLTFCGGSFQFKNFFYKYKRGRISQNISFKILVNPCIGNSYCRHKRRTSNALFLTSKAQNDNFQSVQTVVKGANTRSPLQDPNSFFRKLFCLLTLFWSGKEKRKAWIWTFVTTSLALATTLYAVLLSFIQRFFWSALSVKDYRRFRNFMGIYLIAVLVGPPILVLFDWTKARMSLAWRQFLTNFVLEKYLSDKKFYRLTFYGDIDNPDQRVAEDIRSFTDRAVNLMCVIFVAFFDLAVFSVILFRIYPPLYWTLLAYSIFGTTVTLYFGRNLSLLNSKQLSKEADLRFALVRVRENAETIAFYRGEKRELTTLLKLFEATVMNMIHLLRYQRNLGFFTTGYRYLINLLPSMVAAPIYFQGKIELGTISQTYFSFNHVLNDLSLIVNEFFSLSAFSAVVNRIENFLSVIEENKTWSSSVSSAGNSIKSESLKISSRTLSIPKLQVENLTIRIPNTSRILVRNLSFQVTPGTNYLICGESGVGKSSLLRTLAGLWNDGEGEISVPPPESTFLVPQKPYIVLGSILENILYPKMENFDTFSNQNISRLLEEVNLSHLMERLGDMNVYVDLSNILSLGEQQRLAFARLVASKPKFVLLDESTSALDEDNERVMYNLLKKHNITFVSVGNRASLLSYHEIVLRLFEDGSWKIENIGKANQVHSFPTGQ